jgi:parallel beta-helix repeat protein
MVANSQVSFSNDAIINVTGGTNALNPASGCKLINPRLHETRSYASLPNTSWGIRFSNEINIEIIGGSVDSFTYANIGFGGCTWVDISHINIFDAGEKSLNLGRGIRMYSPVSIKVAINHCNIYGNGHHGIQAFDSGANTIVADQLIISNNFLHDNGDNGVDLIIVSNFSITGNICIDNGDNGLGTGGQGIHVGSTATSPQTFSGSITSNTCSGSVLGFGIELIEAMDVTIGDNICFNNDFSGITARANCKDITIGNNTCKQNQDGIRVDGTTGVCGRITVAGNTCNENGQRGILLNTAEYSTATDNITMNNATGGSGLSEGVIAINGNNNIISGGNSGDTNGTAKQSHGARLHNETDSFIEDVRGKGNTASTVSITGTSSGCDIDMAKKTVTPSALTAGDNNDYDAEDNTVFRMSGDSGGTTVLTGITIGFQNITNTRVRIINVSAFNIVLSHQDAASIDKGRFISPSAANITLAANDIADLEYDLTSSRWRIINVLQ